MPGKKNKSIENDYNTKPGKGAKTDPHQPMDRKLSNGKLLLPTDMQQGQNRQQGVKTNPHRPMDSKQNDEKQHSSRNGKPPPPDNMQQGHNGLQGVKLDLHQQTDPREDSNEMAPMAPPPFLSDESDDFAPK